MKKKPTSPVLAAGVLLLTTGDRSEFLLMRHPDRWDLPKGHAEEGESALQTARREMQEETGIDPGSVQFDPEFRFLIEYPVSYARWADESFLKRVTFFLGRIPAPAPKLTLTEHGAAEWRRWAPPHKIQTRTIDPVLAAVAKHLDDLSPRTKP